MNDKDTYFGFKKVTSKEKTHLVEGVFSDVSSKYDLMNDVMSLGIHRLWKKKFISHIPLSSGKFLDLASGTGDIAHKIFKAANDKGLNPEIFLCDMNYDMLRLARNRFIDNAIINNIFYTVAKGEALPFPDNYFDTITISFGIRNFTDINQALKEIIRILKPNGKFVCLEFSKINPLFKKVYDFYLFKFIPDMGKIIANNKEAYQYLAESIEKFPNQHRFKSMIEGAGFHKVSFENLTYGIAAIHTGYKT